MEAIVVMEDEPSIAGMLGEVVKRLGFIPVVVQNPADFMPSIQRHLPALALVDYMLPGVDGAQLVKQLRMTPAGSRLPVIFITAMPLSTLMERVKQDPSVRFMQKPLDFAAMQRNMQELLAYRESLNWEKEK